MEAPSLGGFQSVDVAWLNWGGMVGFVGFKHLLQSKLFWHFPQRCPGECGGGAGLVADDLKDLSQPYQFFDPMGIP